jgi:hypothetical protein
MASTPRLTNEAFISPVELTTEVYTAEAGIEVALMAADIDAAHPSYHYAKHAAAKALEFAATAIIVSPEEFDQIHGAGMAKFQVDAMRDIRERT